MIAFGIWMTLHECLRSSMMEALALGLLELPEVTIQNSIIYYALPWVGGWRSSNDSIRPSSMGAGNDA